MISRDDFDFIYNGYSRFRKIAGLPRNRNATAKYLTFLGLEAEVWSKVAELPPEARKKIEWLKGPHGYTIYKAWLANHE